jgi:hypothetical protein
VPAGVPGLEGRLRPPQAAITRINNSPAASGKRSVRRRLAADSFQPQTAQVAPGSTMAAISAVRERGKCGQTGGIAQGATADGAVVATLTVILLRCAYTPP